MMMMMMTMMMMMMMKMTMMIMMTITTIMKILVLHNNLLQGLIAATCLLIALDVVDSLVCNVQGPSQSLLLDLVALITARDLLQWRALAALVLPIVALFLTITGRHHGAEMQWGG